MGLDQVNLEIRGICHEQRICFIYRDTQGLWRWRYVASNGETIAVSSESCHARLPLGLFSAWAGRMRGMKDDASGRGSILPIFIGVALVLSPILYVLSCGPVLWLKEHGVIPNDLAGVFLLPAIIVCELSPQLDRLINWYCDLWVA